MVSTESLLFELSSPKPSTDSLNLEKWFPLQGERGHSSYFWSFQKHNRERGQNKNNRPINLPKVITFSTDYKYTTQS